MRCLTCAERRRTQEEESNGSKYGMESFGEPNPEKEETQAINLVTHLWPIPDILPCKTNLRDPWARKEEEEAK